MNLYYLSKPFKYGLTFFENLKKFLWFGCGQGLAYDIIYKERRSLNVRFIYS